MKASLERNSSQTGIRIVFDYEHKHISPEDDAVLAHLELLASNTRTCVNTPSRQVEIDLLSLVRHSLYDFLAKLDSNRR